MAEQTIIEGDCLVEMRKFADKSFDLVLTDPPYGDGIGYGRFDKEIANNEDESINYKALPEIYRLLTEGGGVLPFYELALFVAHTGVFGRIRAF